MALAAEAAGLDGVFCYDHLFRNGRDGTRRPAIEGTTLLGAVAAETSTIAVGTLVARATLRPPAELAAAFDTVHRISGGRLIAAIGAGDSQSLDEMVTFGYDFGTPATRLAALGAAVTASRDHGYPVWIGGRLLSLCELAATAADGWNSWGGDVAWFGRRVEAIRAAAVRPMTPSWGGLVLLGADDEEVGAKRERLGPGNDVIQGTPATVAAGLAPYLDAGAEWIIAGPLDSQNRANCELLADVRSRLRSR